MSHDCDMEEQMLTGACGGDDEGKESRAEQSRAEESRAKQSGVLLRCARLGLTRPGGKTRTR